MSIQITTKHPDNREAWKNRTGLLAAISVSLPALLLLYRHLTGIADFITYEIFTLSPDTNLGEAINFFFYDTLKILILLFLISSLMGLVNAYFPVERLRTFLTTRKLYGLEYPEA